MNLTSRKKIIIGLAVLLSLALILPFVMSVTEKEGLNDNTRKLLGGRFIRLSDGVTHYQLTGPDNGRPVVVLIHGNAAPMCTWDHNVQALLDAGFGVLRYDIFGHGFSDRPDLSRYNQELYDRQLVELLDKLAIRTPAHLIGTSQGGTIAAAFAVNHPEKVGRVALLAPYVDTFSGAKKMAKLKTALVGEYLTELMIEKKLTDPSAGFYNRDKPAGLVDQLKEQLRFKGKKKAFLANLRGDTFGGPCDSLFEHLGNTRHPVLLTWGEADRSIFRSSMEKLRSMVPRIEYHEIQRAAHLAHYERADIVNPILVSFLTGT